MIMQVCKFCSRPAKSNNSNLQHQLRCGSNPNKIVNPKTEVSIEKQKLSIAKRLDERYQLNPSNCRHCGAQLPRNRKHNKFCNSSCAAVYNNAHRSPSARKPGPSAKPKPVKEQLPFSRVFVCVCKHCGLKWVSRSSKKYCQQHQHLYSHNGRAAYWFTFALHDYPDLFDFDLIRKHGFRSASNPNGVTRDHRVSVNEAIRNGYDAAYIKHPLNCQLMLFEENNKKKTKSSMTYRELVELVDAYQQSSLQ